MTFCAKIMKNEDFRELSIPNIHHTNIKYIKIQHFNVVVCGSLNQCTYLVQNGVMSCKKLKLLLFSFFLVAVYRNYRVLMSVCVCVSVCVRDNSKNNFSINLKLLQGQGHAKVTLVTR